MPILHGPRKVCMTGTYTGDRINLSLYGGCVHTLFPVDPVTILYLHRDGRTKRLTVAHACQKTNLILLYLHTSTTTITALATTQIGVNPLFLQQQASRQTLNNNGQAGTV